MHQTWNGAVPVLCQRIFHHTGKRHNLVRSRDDLSADRIGGVFRIDEGDKIGGYIHAEKPLSCQRFALAVGQVYDFIEVLG